MKNRSWKSLNPYKHGHSHHPLYGVWAGIKERCNNKNHPQYKDYGGRGIILNSSWRNFPERFIEWALVNGWEEGLCIDRKNNDDYYRPSNCHFVDRATSNRNQRLLNSCNTTGYRGIGKRGNKYYPRINKFNHSDKTKKRMSDLMSGVNNPMYGKSLPKDIILKRST